VAKLTVICCVFFVACCGSHRDIGEPSKPVATCADDAGSDDGGGRDE
jgi:hypothetical protein